MYDRGLNVIRELTEARTAKEPGRPVFNQMIEMIEKGEADGIVCWKLDRLSRNPLDAGMLRWLMRKRQLLEIHTPHQTYRCDDNAVIAAVESAMAEQYIVDLEKGVHRGMTSKCERGGYPLLAPAGYYNDRNQRTVRVDEERFALLRRGWDLLLSGEKTVPQIHEILVFDWGFRIRSTKCSPAGELTVSGLYKIFNNPFYAGSFTFQGKTYEHAFPRMVTPEEFARCQEILGRRGPKKPVRHAFAFTGLMTCGSCGYYITAEKAKGHTYYHCSNRTGLCSKKGMREEAINAQIAGVLDSITLPPAFQSLAHKILERHSGQEKQAVEEVVRSQEKLLDQIQEQKEKLLTLHLQGLLDVEEYAARKRELVEKETALKRQERNVSDEDKDEAVLALARFCTSARDAFAQSDVESKRALARHLGSYLFNNGELQIELREMFGQVRAEWKKWEDEIALIEPLDIGSGKPEGGELAPVVQRWCTSVLKCRTLPESQLCISYDVRSQDRKYYVQ